uniref:Uncharacterized protein n=1 Tax=Glossina austeni TaxID=7395 RepID=A0A1A9VDL4_GLOAU
MTFAGAESGSIAAYETSQHEQLNMVKSGFLAAYETSHACLTNKQVDFEEATPCTSVYSLPGSDQHISNPIVANVGTRSLPFNDPTFRCPKAEAYNYYNDNVTTTTGYSTTTTVITSPTNRVLPMQQRQYAQRNGNENKIPYETEVKHISSHSPISNGIKGNINNLSNQFQQPSALLNQPLLQAEVTKHALPSLVASPALTYKITNLIGKASNNASEQQQQTQSKQQTTSAERCHCRNKLSLEIQHNNNHTHSELHSHRNTTINDFKQQPYNNKIISSTDCVPLQSSSCRFNNNVKQSQRQHYNNYNKFNKTTITVATNYAHIDRYGHIIIASPTTLKNSLTITKSSTASTIYPNKSRVTTVSNKGVTDHRQHQPTNATSAETGG